MAWAKIDDGWWAHPKVMGLSLASSGLWARSLSWSCQQRRDVVPSRFLAMVGADESHADELVLAGLWHPVEGGWMIHDWDKYQQQSLSEKRADAGRKGGEASGKTRGSKQTRSKPKQKPEANDEAGTRPVPSRPVPTLKDPTAVSTDVDDMFDQFWTAYPRGRGGKPGGDGARKPTLQKWRRLTERQRQTCLVAVENYRAHVEADGGPIAAHAATWLNQERWADWMEPAAPKGRRTDQAAVFGSDEWEAKQRERQAEREALVQGSRV